MISLLGIDEMDIMDIGVEGLVQLDDGRVMCLKCNRVFSNRNNGKRHFATAHQVNQPAKCPLCSKISKNRRARHEHMKKIHGMSEKMMKENFIQIE